MYDFVTGRVVAQVFLFDYLSGQRQLYQYNPFNHEFKLLNLLLLFIKKKKHEIDLWM